MRNCPVEKEQKNDAEPKAESGRYKGPGSVKGNLIDRGEQEAPDRGRHHHAGGKAGEHTLNTDVFSLDEPFKMTASVTDKAGNPVKGVKVGFMILDSEGNLFSDFFSYDWIWNVTRPDGQCSLTVTMRTGEGQVLRPASYQVKLFIVDMEEICDIKPFEFRLESLYLPDSLTAIEAEAFAGTDSQAVFVPEGCVSIGERAFADCSQLYYIHIPAGVTDIADNAFEGCPDCLWIDRE